jgi:Fe-S oxidoreductase
VYNEPREILKVIQRVELAEMQIYHEDAIYCISDEVFCSYDPEQAKRIAADRMTVQKRFK